MGEVQRSTNPSSTLCLEGKLLPATLFTANGYMIFNCVSFSSREPRYDNHLVTSIQQICLYPSGSPIVVQISAIVRAAVCFIVHFAESRWCPANSAISWRYNFTAPDPPVLSDQHFEYSSAIASSGSCFATNAKGKISDARAWNRSEALRSLVNDTEIV